MNKIVLKIIIGLFVLIFVALFAVLILERLRKVEHTNVEFLNKQGETEKSNNNIVWQFNGNSWQSFGDTTSCTNVISLIPPVDFTKVTTLLLPGQIRGNAFKAHGGFRFDGLQNNNLDVVMPIDSKLIRGSMYEENGEIQYMLDFISDCGVMVKFDHILKLSPKLEDIVKNELILGKDGDSRTTNFKTQIYFNSGELIALQVGHKNPLNIALDFGIYDLNTQNLASKNIVFNEKYFSNSETAFYGVCWLNYFSTEENMLLKSIKTDSVEGNVSDYCN